MSAVPCTAAATVAGTMKMADAIIVPALIITASKRPSSRLRSLAAAEGGVCKVMGVGSGAWGVPFVHHKVPLPTPYSHLSKSECGVGIEIQTPTGRRSDRAGEIEPDQSVHEARADAHSGEGPRHRKLFARTGAPDVGEQHDARRRPAVRELEAGAPKHAAAGRGTAVAPQGPRAAQGPPALHPPAAHRCA